VVANRRILPQNSVEFESEAFISGCENRSNADGEKCNGI